MFAGISLPAAYLRRQWRSITILLLPIMTIAWFVSAGLILAFIPGLTFVSSRPRTNDVQPPDRVFQLEALCISACVTPTDPILANASTYLDLRASQRGNLISMSSEKLSRVAVSNTPYFRLNTSLTCLPL